MNNYLFAAIFGLDGNAANAPARLYDFTPLWLPRDTLFEYDADAKSRGIRQAPIVATCTGAPVAREKKRGVEGSRMDSYRTLLYPAQTNIVLAYFGPSNKENAARRDDFKEQYEDLMRNAFNRRNPSKEAREEILNARLPQKSLDRPPLPIFEHPQAVLCGESVLPALVGQERIYRIATQETLLIKTELTELVHRLKNAAFHQQMMQGLVPLSAELGTPDIERAARIEVQGKPYVYANEVIQRWLDYDVAPNWVFIPNFSAICMEPVK